MRDFETAWRLEGGEGSQTEPLHQVGICEEPGALVFVVAGGMGNELGGASASRRTVEIVRKAITGERPNDDAQIWAERLAGIDRMLSRDKIAGETTAIVASIVVTSRSVHVVGASVGDSEAWLIAADGNRADRLTQRQARRPLIGSSAALPVPFDQEWSEGTLLLATNGLFDYAEAAHICATAAEPNLEQAAQSLLDLARRPDGKLQENVGLLLCRRLRKEAQASGKSASLLKSVGKLLNWGRRE